MQELTSEQIKEMLSMMDTNGWRKLIEILTEANQAEKDFAHVNCDTNEEWHYTRGHIYAYHEFLNLENYYKLILEQREEEDGEA